MGDEFHPHGGRSAAPSAQPFTADNARIAGLERDLAATKNDLAAARLRLDALEAAVSKLRTVIAPTGKNQFWGSGDGGTGRWVDSSEC